MVATQLNNESTQSEEAAENENGNRSLINYPTLIVWRIFYDFKYNSLQRLSVLKDDGFFKPQACVGPHSWLGCDSWKMMQEILN